MKATEMIFLDNESLWEKIELYSNTGQQMAELIAIHEDAFAEPVMKVKKELSRIRGELRLMLGFEPEIDILAHDPFEQFKLETNATRQYVDPGMPRVDFPTPEGFVTRKKDD